MGHIRWKQAPEEIRTHLGQELGGSRIHPEQQGLHRQEQEQVLAQEPLGPLVVAPGENPLGNLGCDPLGTLGAKPEGR